EWRGLLRRNSHEDGGERGIRTPEARFRRLHTFQACSFNHSDTSPLPENGFPATLRAANSSRGGNLGQPDAARGIRMRDDTGANGLRPPTPAALSNGCGSRLSAGGMQPAGIAVGVALVLPDGHARLHLVDDVATGGEGGLAMRGGH